MSISTPIVLHAAASTTQALSSPPQDRRTPISECPEKESYFTRIALFWFQSSWWKKMLLLTLLILPTFVLGILTPWHFLLALSIASFFLYLGAHFLLDDHVKTEYRDRKIWQQAAHHLQTMNQELNQQVERLNSQIEQAQQQQGQLRKLINELETKGGVLLANLDASQQALSQTQTELGLKVESLGQLEAKLNALKEGLSSITQNCVEVARNLALIADSPKTTEFFKNLESLRTVDFESLLRGILAHDKQMLETQEQLRSSTQKLDVTETKFNLLEQKYENLYKQWEKMHRDLSEQIKSLKREVTRLKSVDTQPSPPEKEGLKFF